MIPLNSVISNSRLLLVSVAEQVVSCLNRLEAHYANMPMQCTAIFKPGKNDIFLMKQFDIFLIFAQNIGGWTGAVVSVAEYGPRGPWF